MIERVSDYKYDVFISYSRHGSAPKWLLNHFYPKLEEYLIDEVYPSPKIFIDKGMSRGVAWSPELKSALRYSKIMIAVLSAPYFGSNWCMAEWGSMAAREKMLGLASDDRPQGLIYPVRYSDSVHFENEGRLRSWWDFKGLDGADRAFHGSKDWHAFQLKVRDCARDLAELLRQVPPWQPDWPIIKEPNPVLVPPPPMPRFDP
ncbi:TIR domain-containing protein [Amycolatopsis regifaucium]|nr:TIR domain-containing protein [Amycolatopsis regifaucium]